MSNTTEAVGAEDMKAVESKKVLADSNEKKTEDVPPQQAGSTVSDVGCSSAEENQDAYVDGSTLTKLARQLEYYFSKANLSKDTYLQTLRDLNDGYVPVSILGNFQMVNRLVPYDGINAVIQATKEFSPLLEIVFVDTNTGKRVNEESSSTIWAVGPSSGEPLDAPSPSAPSPAVEEPVPHTTPIEKSPIQNTIILRDVDVQVTEEEVRALFEGNGCPPLQSLYLDVASCWFVTLDTTSQDDMLSVMFQLRSKTLRGDPVKARLKSLVRNIDASMAPPLPILLSPSQSMTQLAPSQQFGTPNKKKKKKKRSKNKNNNKKSSSPKNGANTNDKNNASAKKDKLDAKDILAGAEFPALTHEKVQLVVVKDGMEDSETNKQPLSDAASTATTTSSSSSSQKQQVGCYAAALLKSKPADAKAEKTRGETAKEKEQTPSSADSEMAVAEKTHHVADVADDTASTGQTTVTAVSSPVVVTPPTWGGGRSFADVLKKEEAGMEAGMAC